ncbi:PEP-CTERM sorting domain-containing protein [Tundrisphaera sp. TA3]|uniref:PEP-CTERM sorting domain-containing protein n=1 Tax=Tundrisphaera sp. TA3 TaxID=3435775 RepID=UPI003EB6A19A
MHKLELDAGRNASFAIDVGALTLEIVRTTAVPEPSTLILSGIALLAATVTRACRAN